MEIREAIQRELEKIEREKAVKILHAAESGSRAWGFASPDSDYDVRFVYVRPMSDYLRINPPRDVIEWKLDEVLDINGWDLQKTMRQIAGGNPTVFEWDASPIVYRTTPEWRKVIACSRAYFSEKHAVGHYYGTAMSTWAKHLTEDTVRYKKYFYALRPLLAAIYIEQAHQIPPVLFSELLKMDMPGELRFAIDVLLERKKTTTEGERSPHIPEVRDFIREELERQKSLCAKLPEDRNPDWGAMNRCFAEIILPEPEREEARG